MIGREKTVLRGRIDKALRRLGLAAALLAGSGSFAASQEQAAAFKDEIFARKILMDTIDNHADALDWMLGGGKPFDFARAVEHADTISVLLMVFPHLFPPATNQWQPDARRDPARDTYASPDLWAHFADFYGQAATASQIAFKASRAKSEAEFRRAIAGLRSACESCHTLYMKSDQ